MIDVGVFTDKPNKNFDIFFAPIFFYPFIFDHPKMKKEVLFDSDVYYFGNHVRTDVKIVSFFIFYICFAMSHDILS